MVSVRRAGSPRRDVMLPRIARAICLLHLTALLLAMAASAPARSSEITSARSAWAGAIHSSRISSAKSLEGFFAHPDAISIGRGEVGGH